MTIPQPALPAPPWKHWWIWCLGCIALGGLLLVDYAQRHDFRPADSLLAQDARSSDAPRCQVVRRVCLRPLGNSPTRCPETPARPPAIPRSTPFCATSWGAGRTSLDLITTHCTQVFVARSMPFDRFCSSRADESRFPKSAARLAKRPAEPSGGWAESRDRSSGTGGEEAIRGGAFVFNALEQAADWLQSKTVANVDPQLPEGGWFTPDQGTGSRTEPTEIVPRLRGVARQPGQCGWKSCVGRPSRFAAHRQQPARGLIPRMGRRVSTLRGGRARSRAARCSDGCWCCSPVRAAFRQPASAYCRVRGGHQMAARGPRRGETPLSPHRLGQRAAAGAALDGSRRARPPTQTISLRARSLSPRPNERRPISATD